MDVEHVVNKKPTIDYSKVEIEPLFQDMVDFETFSKSDFRAVKVKECRAVPKSKKLLEFVLDDGSGGGPHDPERHPRFLRAGTAGGQDAGGDRQPAAAQDDGHRFLPHVPPLPFIRKQEKRD